MRVTKQVKINKMLYKIEKMLKEIIEVSDILASGAPEAKPLKTVKKAKSKKKA